MSEKEIYAEMLKDKTFKDAEGLPANAHAKKLAKAASKKEKEKVKIYYTQNGPKIVKIYISAKGARSEYVGNVMKEKNLQDKMKEWRTQGIWIDEHEYQEKSSKIREQMAAAK
jgi:predicted peroxiredoxin